MPEDAPIALASDGAAWTLGAFSNNFVDAGHFATDFAIVGMGFALPNINADFTVILYYGAADTFAASVGFNRSGVIPSSIYRDIGKLITASSRVRAKLKDSVGGGTCVGKIYCKALTI